MSDPQARKLPDGWRYMWLRDIGKTTSGGTPSRTHPKYYGGNISWVKSGELNDGWIYKSAETLTTTGIENSSAKVFPAGTLLIAMYGATVGKIGILGIDAATNQAVCAIFPNEETDRDYLFHYLLNERPKLVQQSFGGAQPNISQDVIKNIRVNLPPLPEQKRIAALLTEQMTAIDRARAAAEAQLQAAKELPAAFLRSVFDGPETEKWEKMSLGEISTFLPAKSLASDGDAEIKAITTACLTEVGFRTAGIKTARMRTQDIPECTVKPGEVLIARSNTPELVGRVSMFPGEPAGVVASDLTIRVMPSEVCTSAYLTAYLSYLYLTGYWKERAGGASGSMKKITRTQLSEQRIPVPSREQQGYITCRIGQYSRLSIGLQDSLAMQLDAINQLPAALLRKAFAGEL